MKPRQGSISDTVYLITILALAGAAAFVAYYLYIYSPPSRLDSQLEITARPVTGSNEASAGFRIQYTFTPDELKRRLISEIVVPKPVSKARSPAIKPSTPPLSTRTETKIEEKSVASKATDLAKIPSSEPEGKTASRGEAGKIISSSVWVLNVISTEDPQKALRFVDMLQKTPYHVYTYKVEGKNESWYRVRVGFFFTFKEAEAAAALLVEKYQMPRAWILTPDPMEVAKYFRSD